MSLTIKKINNEIEFSFDNGLKITISDEHFTKEVWMGFLTKPQYGRGFTTLVGEEDGEDGLFTMTKVTPSQLQFAYDSGCGIKFEYITTNWKSEFERMTWDD